MCGVELLGKLAVGGVSPRRATIAEYTSSPITRPAKGGVSPRRATMHSTLVGWGVCGMDLLGKHAVGGVSPRRAAIAQRLTQ